MHMKYPARRLAAGLTMVGTALAMSGCSSDDAGAANSPDGGKDEPLRLAFFNYDVSSTFTKAYGDAITEVAEASGATVQIFDAAVDPQQQFRQIQDATSSGKYDGYLVYAVDGPSVMPAVEDAIAAGIQVVGVGSALGPDNSTAEPQVEGMVGAAFNPVDNAGKALAELVVDACADKSPCKTGYLLGDPSFRNSIEFLDAVKEDFAQHPNIKIEIVTKGGFLAGPAYTATQDMLTGNPDLDVIASDGDQMIAGAEKALVDSGMKPGQDILLAGTGASAIAVEGIKKGTWYGTTIWLPFSSGEAATEMLLAAIRDESVDDNAVEDIELSDRGAVLTPDNVDGFTAEWAG